MTIEEALQKTHDVICLLNHKVQHCDRRNFRPYGTFDWDDVSQVVATLHEAAFTDGWFGACEAHGIDPNASPEDN